MAAPGLLLGLGLMQPGEASGLSLYHGGAPMGNQDPKHDGLLQRLREAEARCDALSEAASDLVFEIDAGGRYLHANRAHRQLLGFTPEELVGSSFYRRVHLADRSALRAALTKPELEPVQFRVRTSGGSWAHLAIAGGLPGDRDGTARLLVAKDVSEPGWADDALRDGEERFRGILERLAQPIVVFDGDDRLPIYYNPAFGRLFEFPEGAVHCGPGDFLARIHPDDRGKVREWLDEQFERPTTQTYRFLRPDGSTAWIQGETDLIRTDDGRVVCVVAIGEDVTEERKTEHLLSERARVFRLVAENIPGAAYLFNNVPDPGYGPDRGFLYLGDTIEDLTGLPASEFREGRRSLLELMHPEDRPAYVESVTKALTEKQPTLVLFRIRHANGGWRWLEQRGRGIWDEEGALRLLGGAFFDVTDRVQGEEAKRQLEAQLFQAQKLESLGVLAGGIAHDFNNMMGVVTTTSELALQELAPHHPARTLIEESLKATRRAATLTRQLLAYAGRGLAEIRRVDITEQVRETGELLLRSIPKKIELDLQLTESLPPVEVDVAHMQQVVMNLVINASEAIGARSGTIRLRSGLTRISPGTPRRLLGGGRKRWDRYVFLRVEDDGEGMSPETQERIFDPFFTTKENGHGLGLAAVLGIVRAHGGEIELESSPGVGTAVTVYLPVARGEANTVKPAEVADLDGEARILVVDDEHLIRDAACQVLSRYGYEALPARDGSEAVNLFAEQASRIDLVLLDLSMPGLNGDEVFPIIRKLRPDIPIVFSSGYAESESLARFTREPHTAFLHKPYGAEELARIVKATLRR